MKLNITPSHSPSLFTFPPPNIKKYSVFSEWKNPVTRAKKKKRKFRLFSIAKMFVLFQRLTGGEKKKKRDLLGGVERTVHEKISLFGISNSFL